MNLQEPRVQEFLERLRGSDASEAMQSVCADLITALPAGTTFDPLGVLFQARAQIERPFHQDLAAMNAQTFD